MTLAVRGLAAPFGMRPGLVDIDLDVDAGERLVIVGASGSGKTTLLRAIAGLQRTTDGTVTKSGDAIYLQQTPVLFPHLTVYENVAFPLRVRGVTDVDERVRAALVSVRLGAFAPRMSQTLSGGQAHRVALARAVVARPAVLLLDEPLSSLDPSLRDDVRRTILGIHEEWGGALVVVTHDLDDASALAHRVAVLQDRRIAQIAPLAELFARPASLAVARFLGASREVPGIMRADGAFDCVFGTVVPGHTGATPGQAIAMVRAEAVRRGDSGPVFNVVAVRVGAHGTVATLSGGVDMLVDGFDPPRVGDRLQVTLDPRGVIVFPT